MIIKSFFSQRERDREREGFSKGGESYINELI